MEGRGKEKKQNCLFQNERRNKRSKRINSKVMSLQGFTKSG